MIIVIDAYNLLKQLYGAQVTQKQVQDYLDYLNAYAKKKKHKMVVIFDGGPYEHPMREKYGVLITIYSGYQATADDAIEAYLHANKTKEVLLVTDDNQLRTIADQLAISFVDALQFDKLIKESMAKPKVHTIVADTPVQKLHPEKTDEVIDELMKDASAYVMQKPEEQMPDETPTRKSKMMTLSKKERKLWQKLSKL